MLTLDAAGGGESPRSTSVDEGGSAEEVTADVSRWPMRWGSDPSNRGVIIPLDRPWSEFQSAHLGRHHTMRSSDIEYSDASELAGAVGIESGFKFRAEAPGSFVFVPRVEQGGQSSSKPEPDLAFKFVSAQQIEDNPEQDMVRIQRTWFTYFEPADPNALVGTIVILPGMFGTPVPVVDAAQANFQLDGWAVLRMMAHPSGFTAHKRVAIEEARLGEIAAEIAIEYDQRTAECAYAVDAALDHVFGLHAELEDHPVVLLGMSGGAMVLPAVYAHAPDRFDASVLVAGGANSMLITAMSNYKEMIDAVRLDYDPSTDRIDGKPTRSVLMTLSEAYLEQTRLDAIVTAHEMREIPVLMLHAKNDKAVPAKRGVDLYNALGHPERWQYPVGHELIFAALPAQYGRIDRWIKRELGIKSTSPSPESVGEDSP